MPEAKCGMSPLQLVSGILFQSIALSFKFNGHIANTGKQCFMPTAVAEKKQQIIWPRPTRICLTRLIKVN